MCKIICVTNRHICNNDYINQINKIASSDIDSVILREKDMNDEEYRNICIKLNKICAKNGKELIINSNVRVANECRISKVHLPMHILRTLGHDEWKNFTTLGASCHSVEEAVEAEKSGCTYIVAGHIFATDCKRDLKPRGIEFLKSVCQSVTVPVYAIGGISRENIKSVMNAGAGGVCFMSGLMMCDNPKEFIEQLKEGL